MIKSADITDKLIMYFIEHGMQIVTGIGILVVGLFCSRWVGNVVQRWLEKHKLEPQIRKLLTKLVWLIVFAMFAIVALGQMGIQITPLLAGIGVAGVGLSLATQSVLGNLVAGLNIIFTKPFTVGEYIELLGVYGQVQDISLFSTTLLHADNSRVVVPNRKIVGEILHNYGKIRQMNSTVGVAYDADIKLAIATIKTILDQNPRVLKDPAPVVGVSDLADSSVVISVMPWVAVPDYFVAQTEINQAIIEQFAQQKISIPFPQREIRLIGQGN
ncbi:MAG TPA: mechanosensitive ion channel family protein [Nitrospirota bacterium]|nr:mechanosensitive ion channel family protein [Nitrospirota bacterium]HUK99631.1 mechanosensitive ion channel family protein [Nitrospirota bacterium]